jgi:asparagine synthase (glutamine-hydrolysing)
MEANHFQLEGAQRRATTRWPLPMYLRIEDRVSMAHSVEARLPFTDYRLVEHAFCMPDSLKFSAGLNKRALRRVAARRVPDSVVARSRKLGFPVSDGMATANGLHALCTRLAASPAFAARGIYDLAGVKELLGRPPRTQDVDALFQLAQTELWLNEVNDGGVAAR